MSVRSSSLSDCGRTLFIPALACAALLAASGISCHAADPSQPTDDRGIGPYRIEIFGRADENNFANQVLRISRNGGVLATVEDYRLSLDPNHAGIEENQLMRPQFGGSVTGNGIPNLVVYAFNNNAYGFSTLHIFELGAKTPQDLRS